MEYKVVVVALSQFEIELNALALLGWQVETFAPHPSAAEVEVIVVLKR